MKRRSKRRNDEDDDNGFAAWGGYMAAKKSKLLDQFSSAVEKETIHSNIFKGISIFVNGYTKPSAEELKQMMSSNGGIYHHYHIPNRTMYTIASNLPDTKIKQLGASQKIVKPDWIADSLKAGKLLDYRNYLLYTNQNRTQPRLNFGLIQNDALSNNSENTVQIGKMSADNDLVSNPVLPNMFFDEVKEIEFNSDESLFESADFPEKYITSDIVNTASKTVDIPNSPAKTKEENSRTLTANNPKFLSEFYNNSRLHHISTLGALFKQHVSNLREKSNFKFPERVKFKEYVLNSRKENVEMLDDMQHVGSQSVIMHIDMDCFFVSVGLRSRPELRGLPVAVTHSRGGNAPSHRSGVDRQAELNCYKQRLQEKSRSKDIDFGPGNMLLRLENIENQSMSEIASCSYEARKAGCKNGMFMGAALQLCPNLKTIPYDFDGYKEVAYALYNTIAEYTLNIEAVSCDEMFVDITDLLSDSGASVMEWATYVRTLIQERTGCPCSAGFGANRLQARMATKTAKPSGQFHLVPGSVEQYMLDINASDLPGVGRSMSNTLKSMNISTCGDLQCVPRSKLRSEFGGKVGDTLYKHCRGIDERPLVYDQERKSVSAEVNYGIRFKTHAESETFLKQLAEEVHSRLTEIRMKGKCITLKLMVRSKDAPAESSKYMGHGICDYITKSSSLPTAVSDLSVITREVLLISQRLAVAPTELRGIGIQISRLEKLEKNVAPSILARFLSTSKNENKEMINQKKTHGNNETLEISHAHSKQEITKIIADIRNVPIELEETEAAHDESKTPIITANSEMKTKSLMSLKHGNNQKSLNSSKTRGRPKGRGNKTLAERIKYIQPVQKVIPLPPLPLLPPPPLSPSQTQNNIEHQVLPSHIDMDVLAALPEEIQLEILQLYGIKLPTFSVVKNHEPASKNLMNARTLSVPSTSMASDNVPEIEIEEETIKQSQFAKQTTDQSTSVIPHMKMSEIKTLLQNWVDSESIPEKCDIKMLADHFKNLAIEKNIDMLFDILEYFYRVIKKKDCKWHNAYFDIVQVAQEGMLSKYGKPIWHRKYFTCKNNCGTV